MKTSPIHAQQLHWPLIVHWQRMSAMAGVVRATEAITTIAAADTLSLVLSFMAPSLDLEHQHRLCSRGGRTGAAATPVCVAKRTQLHPAHKIMWPEHAIPWPRLCILGNESFVDDSRKFTPIGWAYEDFDAAVKSNCVSSPRQRDNHINAIDPDSRRSAYLQESRA